MADAKTQLPSVTAGATLCLLISKGGGGAPSTVLEVQDERATLGARGGVRIDAAGVLAEHARLERGEEGWTLVPSDGALARVNGVRLRRPWPLQAGDRISLGEARLIFYPNVIVTGGLPSPANGFSRARHHVARALSATPDEERSFLERLAQLEEAIDDVEKHAAVHPAIEHMEKRRFEQAERILEQATRAYPGDAEILVQLAVCQANAEKFSQAKKTLSGAARTADEKLLKVISDLQRQVDEAIAQQAARASLERTMACLKRNDHAGAITALESLSAEVRARPDVRFLEHAARAQRLAASPGAARVAGDTAALIAEGLEAILRQSDDEDLQREVRELLDQVRRMR